MVAQPLNLGLGAHPGIAAQPQAAAPRASGVEGYFAQELADLREVGKLLGASHPELARNLAREANNPDIERLLEGTAYLCAQIRARNDACAPELTNDLAELTAPWLLRAMPSCTVVEFTPDLAQAPARQLVPQHTQVVGAQPGLVFRTVTSIQMAPIVAKPCRWAASEAGRMRLTVPCALGPKATWADLARDGLRFYIDGPLAQASDLHLALTHYIVAAQIRLPGRTGPIAVRIAPTLPGHDAPLTPHFAGEAPMPLGLGLLRDHMVLPQKFLFVQVDLPPDAVTVPLGDSLTLELEMAPDAASLIDASDLRLRLHCVCAVNIVAQDAMPLRHNPVQTRHVLRPQSLTGGSQSENLVLAVRDVAACSDAMGPATPIAPWHRRSHAHRASALVYALEPAQGIAPARLHVFAAADRGEPIPCALPHALSVRLWCHSGAAAGGLAPGSLRLQAQSLGRTRATNLVATTRPRPGPNVDNPRFAVLSLMQHRGRLATDAPSLQKALALAQLDEPEANSAGRAQALRAASVLAISHRPAARLWGGGPVLCDDVTLTLQPSGFASLGDAHLFARCIDALWADQKAVHGAVRTTWVAHNTGRSFSLPMRCGSSQQGLGTAHLGGDDDALHPGRSKTAL